MTFQIIGIGTALPSELITQDDAARLAIELTGSRCSDGPTVQALYRKAGVKKRHSTVIDSSTNGQPATQAFFPIAAERTVRGPTTGDRMRRYEADAIELATRAAASAPARGGNFTGRDFAPGDGFLHRLQRAGVDVGLIDRLSLAPGTSRTNIGFMGCHGALNGLRTAAALSASNTSGKVLMCCVELCTLHHQYSAVRSQIIANALFSDGAAAIVGTTSQTQGPAWEIAGQFSHIVPNTRGLMAWQIGDNGFEMHLSHEVPRVIEANLRPWLARELARHQLATSDVKSWAIHPGGPRILTAAANALGLPDTAVEPSRAVLEQFGNMSSPTVLFILEKLRLQSDCLPCVVLAFGPGLTIEAALIV